MDFQIFIFKVQVFIESSTLLIVERRGKEPVC